MIMADASSAANTNLKKKNSPITSLISQFCRDQGDAVRLLVQKKEAELRNNHAETTHPQSFTNIYVNVITQVSH